MSLKLHDRKFALGELDLTSRRWTIKMLPPSSCPFSGVVQIFIKWCYLGRLPLLHFLDILFSLMTLIHSVLGACLYLRNVPKLHFMVPSIARSLSDDVWSLVVARPTTQQWCGWWTATLNRMSLGIFATFPGIRSCVHFRLRVIPTAVLNHVSRSMFLVTVKCPLLI